MQTVPRSVLRDQIAGQNSTLASKHEAATALASVGLPVIQLWPNTKRPIQEGWQHAGTTNPTKIASLWKVRPDANVGVVTTGWLVIDVDKQHGGLESWKELLRTRSVPATWVVLTPSGGEHHYFELPPGVLRANVNGNKNPVFGKGIDVKSTHGQVVAAGSSVDGVTYEWKPGHSPEDMLEAAQAPEWMIAMCQSVEKPHPLAGQRLVPEDETTHALIQEYLTYEAPQAEEGFRDDVAVIVAQRFYDYAAEPQTCREYLHEWNVSNCHPPLPGEQIDSKPASVLKSRKGQIGCLHPAAGFFPVAINEDEGGRELFPYAEAFDPGDIPPRRWVVSDFACRGKVSMLTGPAGVAKSTYTNMVGLAVATGRGDICGFDIPRRARVAIFNQEDELEEMQRRLAALMAAFGVSWADLQGPDGHSMLCLASGVENPLTLARRTADGAIRATAAATKAWTELKAKNVELAIFDPLAEMHEAVENDNVQMRSVVSIVREIAVRSDCAGLLVTHTKKPPEAGSDGFAGNMDSARGASSQIGVIRIGATLFSGAPKDAKAWNMTGSHLDYVRLDIAKNNLARRTGEPIWFKRDSVRVGAFEGGEDVGLLRPVTLSRTSKASGRSDILHEVAGAIARHLQVNTPYRVADLLPHLTGVAAASLAEQKNRARLLNEAFGAGNTDHLTDFGIVRRCNGGGNKGVLLELLPFASEHLNSAVRCN